LAIEESATASATGAGAGCVAAGVASGGGADGSAAAVRNVLVELTPEDSGQRVATVDDDAASGALAAGGFGNGLF